MNDVVAVQSADLGKDFHCCYLLMSESEDPRWRNKTYIGYTVNPLRRIRQHNEGTKFGGAKQTENRGPWQMLLIVRGFMNEKSGLRFEWAWQKPTRSRRLKEKRLRKNSNETHVRYRLRVLGNMLTSHPWDRLPLTVQWLSEEKKEPFPPKNIILPNHIKVTCGPVNFSQLNSEEQASKLPTNCCKCFQLLNKREAVECVEKDCIGIFHVECLASCRSSNESCQFLIPVEINCPLCQRTLLWGDIIRFKQKFL